MGAVTDNGIYIGFRIMISQPLKKDTYRTTRNVAWDYGYVWVMCSVRKGGKLYFDIVKKGERGRFTDYHLQKRQHSAGDRHMTCRSLPGWVCTADLAGCRFPLSSQADLSTCFCHCIQWLWMRNFVSHCHKDTDWMCLNVRIDLRHKY